MPVPEWQLHPSVHPMTMGTLLDCVTELGSATQGLIDKGVLFNVDGGARVFQSVVRQISVPLRKLCLDGDGALLKNVVANPFFNPLGGNKGAIPPCNDFLAYGTQRVCVRFRRRQT